MGEKTEYQQKLGEAINARREWLEESEIPKMKDEIRNFRTSFSAMYALYLKKGLINEDPYKEESRLNDIEIPKADAYADTQKVEQLSIRLAMYDNQLDYLVNFYQLNTEFLGLEQIKKVVGLIKYIDWCHLSTDSSSPTTRGVTDITNQVRLGTDPMGQRIIHESTSALSKTTVSLLNSLKIITDFRRELYKCNVRDILAEKTDKQKNETPSVAQIKKIIAGELSGEPFYPDLIDELIKEDYSGNGSALRDSVLKSLATVEKKAKVTKQVNTSKIFLIDGILALASAAATFAEVTTKVDANEVLLEHKKVSVWTKIKRIIQEALNRRPDPTIYTLQFVDTVKGVTVKEQVNFTTFRADMERKIKNLSVINAKSNVSARLEAMSDDQLLSFLEKSIRDIQGLHRTLSALDEYFKENVDSDDRGRVRGIKPELATIKNAFVKANQKYHDYTAQKEEEEQFKNLGIQ
jgi:hypothetical protein